LQGLALALRGEGTSAIAEYFAAVDLDPRQDVWRYELAVLLKQHHRLREAFQREEITGTAGTVDRDADFRSEDDDRIAGVG